jgi:hypothetical protein
MKTAEAIECITDAGKFEILATRVLRIADDDCRLLEHMGVNAAGKTVPNPVDGFCRVPGTSPPRFVMAAFTTINLDFLERKWLFDHSSAKHAKRATEAADDGDLIKASQRAKELRGNFPDATFVVHLCTNKQPSDHLIAQVLTKGQDLGLDVRFLTQSCIRDILDVNPDGQWLRKEHLGILAERLSFPLLKELSAKSLRQYGREFLITPPDAFVTTSSERSLSSSMLQSRSFFPVTGSSGSGKSVCCYQVLRNHLTQGGVGLWIPGEIAARATSLEDAVSLTLRSLHTTIEPTAGSIALALGSPSQRLVVVVDDINRGGNPSETIRKLLVWGHPSSDGSKNSTLAPYALLVPVWDLFWAPLDKQFSSANWLSRIPVTTMDEAEALACLTAALGPHLQKVSTADRKQIVAELGSDPILIAMYADSVVKQSVIHPPVIAIDVIDRFVEIAEQEAATSHAGHLKCEYEQALSRLAKHMLIQRNLYPPWEKIHLWLQADGLANIDAIRELSRLGKICRITSRSGENHFEFRHDRILEHFFAHALQLMLSEREVNTDVLSDPFYVSFLGRALAFCQPSDELLEWIRQNAPIALIASLRFLSVLPNDIADRMAMVAKHWLDAAAKNKRTPQAILFEAYRLLEEMDTPYLLNITESLGHHRLLARARLANGDAAAGAIEFSDTRWFAPAVNDRGLDAILSRAFHRHKEKLIRDSIEMLQRLDLSDADRRGILIMAGFVADESLAASVKTAWNRAKDESSILLPALWAGLRCATTDPENILDGLMSAWAMLPEDNTGRTISERTEIAEELRFAITRGITEPVLGYLIEKARSNEALHWPIIFMLQHLDQPLAVTFIVEEAADIQRRIKETGSISPFTIHVRDQWDPTRERSGKRLPPEAIQTIRNCWESNTADPQLRETAFQFWVSATDNLETLRSISVDHPQFKTVLRRRATLGDLSAASLIKPLISSDNDWFRFIGKIWTEQFTEVLDNELLSLRKCTPSDYTGGSTNAHYMLADLLRDIPSSKAQSLLVKHWDHLKFSKLFVQVALYIGSPECISLVTDAIRDYPENVDPFEHINFLFGFMISGLNEHLEFRHIEVLLPYVTRLSDHVLIDMAKLCQRRGYREWGRKYLKPEFDRRRSLLPKVAKEKEEYVERLGRIHFPSDKDLLEKLDWIEQQGKHSDLHLQHWAEEFERRQDDHARYLRILNEWLTQNPIMERFSVFAEAVHRQGTREDIALLYKFDIAGDTDEIMKMRANAKFEIMRRTLQ